MNPQAAQQAQNYLRTRVLTATPEQLQMMLFDGAIRFCEQGKAALEKKDFDASYTSISKAQKIVLELNASLKHDVSPDLCGKLAAIYNYTYRKLLEANVGHELEPMGEAIRMLRYQRETWALLMDQLGKSKAATAAKGLMMPGPDARMEASISMRG